LEKILARNFNITSLFTLMMQYLSRNSSKAHVRHASSGPATLAISVGLQQ